MHVQVHVPAAVVPMPRLAPGISRSSIVTPCFAFEVIADLLSRRSCAAVRFVMSYRFVHGVIANAFAAARSILDAAHMSYPYAASRARSFT